MATIKNFTMKQFNGTDYDTLYPETIAAQIPDVYSRNQTLSSSVSALYGLGSNATPNDVFGWIGKYNQYWWLHYVLTDGELVLASNPYVYSSNRNAYPDNGYTSYTYVTSLTSAGTCYVMRESTESSTTIAYSSSINILATDNIQLVNPQYLTLTRSSAISEVDVLKGMYIQNYPYTSITDSNFITATIFIPSTATFTEDYDGSTSNRRYWIRTENAQGVIVSSVPDSTDYYVYLGIPFENMLSKACIVAGSYIGTGTYGADNPNSLTFDFVPKTVFLYESTPYNYNSIPEHYIFHKGQTYFMTPGASPSNSRNHLTWNGFTVSWYTSSSASGQFNNSGTEYFYTAIG